MDVVGVDVGFGYTKAFNGEKSVVFKSVLGDATQIQFRSSLGPDQSGSNLHVTLDGKSYFIGSYAERQSNAREFTLNQDTLITDFVKVLAITAIGVCCEKSTSLNVVSGLPVGFLTRDYKRFADLITGRHEIIFHNEDKNDVTRRIHINKVHMIPQPVGSIFNLLMDDSGKINNRDLSHQKIGVVDIGFKTTDFSIFDRLQYIERSSTTLDTGISKCFSVIANKLRQESGVNIELFRMFDFMESGTIKIRGREYNLANLKKRVYTHAATAIAADVNRLWEDDWDIDSIILSGGGGMELAPYIQPHLQGNVIPIANGVDARLNNVQGYLKFGRYKWRHLPSPESVEQNEATSETREETETGDGQDTSEKNSRGAKGLGWLKGNRT
ncbi:MAG: ParM/StbA family protein [Desulfobacterium sp.]|nr:ParM/StbA family protein [Desulfobacterium sp.]